MTIYILDKDPAKCAEYLDDKSLDRMICDIAQVLCNVNYLELNNIVERNKMDFINSYPFPPITLDIRNKSIEEWTQWVRSCKANYRYLWELGFCLLKEYHERFDIESNNVKDSHKMTRVIGWAREHEPDLPESERTQFLLVMPKKFVIPPFQPDHVYHGLLSIIMMYRSYYQSKIKNPVWTRREKPEWLELED